MSLTMLDAPVTITVPSSASWVDIDLADYCTLPASGLSGVILNIVTMDGYEAGARKNGSTDTLYKGDSNGSGSDHAWQCWCGVDSAGKFEVYAENKTQSYFYVMGYTTRGFTFFTNGTQLECSTISNWTDLDCSAYVPSTATGLIFWIRGGSWPVQFGIRAKGSTDAYYGHRGGSAADTLVMACNTSQIVQYWSSSSANRAVLMGYIDADSGGTFFSSKAAHDHSTTSTSAYVDLAVLPTDSNVGLFEVLDTSALHTAYIKPKGSTAIWPTGLNGYCSKAIPCDTSFLCQGKVENSALHFYLTAYFVEAPANPMGGGIGVGDCMIL